jgi:ppGpp synthetase/RelA/SpoT-type nucleotidyltranferase
MTYEEFQEVYLQRIGQFKHAARKLKTLLDKGLKNIEKSRELEGLPVQWFRIRLKEARVKECLSLFNKVNGDRKFALEKVFEPGHVRDVIGARLVCHNLKDAEKVVNIFKQGKWPGLQYLQRSDEDKNWLHRAQEDSGYRGYHFDVRWPSGVAGRSDYAELQVRTLVQDAWATFMHDDVYKHEADVAISQEIRAQVREMSHLLYWVDQWADRIRGALETSTVSPSSHVPAIAAVAKAMYAMAGFFRQIGPPTQYLRVKREDVYEVREDEPRFRFVLQADATRRCEFSFAIGGDTPVANCKIHRVARKHSGGVQELTGSEFALTSRQNTVIIVDKNRQKLHDYEIECSWRGVFERGREYVWCPWADLYPNADMQYQLKLSFDKQPKKRPRLYRFDDFDNPLADISEAFSSDSPKGSEALETQMGGKWYYTFNPEPARQNFLCLFEIGR